MGTIILPFVKFELTLYQSVYVHCTYVTITLQKNTFSKGDNGQTCIF